MPRPKTNENNALTSGDGSRTIADTVTINVPVSRELHRQFRMKALTLDMTVADAITDAIERWVAA